LARHRCEHPRAQLRPDAAQRRPAEGLLDFLMVRVVVRIVVVYIVAHDCSFLSQVRILASAAR
jgi:hypothetical protein